PRNSDRQIQDTFETQVLVFRKIWISLSLLNRRKYQLFLFVV
ncbi:unnamed protein product, partial [Allacma fusca]